MIKSKNLESKIGYALDILSIANDAMIEVIQEATYENGDKLYYSVNGEKRYIGGNEDDDWCIFDENGDEIAHLEDLSADELYEICINI